MSEFLILLLYICGLALLGFVLWVKVIRGQGEVKEIVEEKPEEQKQRDANGAERGRLIREANRQAQREAEELRQRRIEQDERFELRRKRQDEREAQEQEEKKREEEQKIERLEEYKAWKGQIQDLTSEELLVEDLTPKQMDDLIVSKLKREQVVDLDVLASITRYKSKQVVDTLVRLESENRISGVLDERGKYIFFDEESFKEMKKYVEKRGRVGLKEMIHLGQKLLSAQPTISFQ